jgi:tRNA-specific 2-thiouridylase
LKKRVVVGLSGGVDSSVAAWLLQQQGYDVVGLFMRNWHDTTGTLSGDCPWEDDQIFAELVAKKLDIPFHFVDLSEQYRARVVDYMFAEYARGRTPNPDVLCNREIKFDVFMDEAFKLGADFVATGHYCRVERLGDDAGGWYRLLAGVDPGKDQSYFLCQLSQEQLSRAMFPIGGLLKSEVRRIAEEQKLATAKRKDSQGICFVGKVDLPTFLQQKLAAKRGDIIEVSAEHWAERESATGAPRLGDEFDFSSERCACCADRSFEGEDSTRRTASTEERESATGALLSRKVGEHNGAHFYTIGQRKGLGVGGKAEPLFVIGTDVERNIVYVGQGDNHPGLWRGELFVRESDIHWVRPDRAVAPGGSERFSFRIRYRQPLQWGTLHHLAAAGGEFPDAKGGGGGIQGGGLHIVFDNPQRGVTPGQFAAWYDGDELIGSGVIDR